MKKLKIYLDTSEKMIADERNKEAKPAVVWLLSIVNKPVKIIKPNL